MSKLIIEEPPLQVLPSLAIRIGLNEAIVLQQLHYLLRDPRFGRRVAEHQWIFNTVEQWQCQYFPFWSARTIKTVFSNLRRLGLIETCQPEGRISRRQYYRINEEELAIISDGAKFVPSKGQILPHGNGQNSSLPITKTTEKTSLAETTLSKEAEATSLRDERCFSAFWKPISGTKAEQLKRIETNPLYPSEREFDAFLEEEGLDELASGKSGDLYDRLSQQKWHVWNGRRWFPIRDWEAFVRGLNTKIESATHGGF